MSKSDSDMILQMYKILQEVRDDLKTKPSRDEVNERFDHVFTVLDRQSGMLDTDETERLLLNSQVNRHEDLDHSHCAKGRRALFAKQLTLARCYKP